MKNPHCSFCKPSEEYSHLKIKDGGYWRVELRDRQNYLGWSFIILKRHVEDLSEVNESEWSELRMLISQLKTGIKSAFRSTKFNYASFGNEISHVHVQIVPRYKSPVKFKGILFEDKRWGSNYSPYDKRFEISEEIHKAIIEKIKLKF